jgi:hypothetical protein
MNKNASLNFLFGRKEKVCSWLKCSFLERENAEKGVVNEEKSHRLLLPPKALAQEVAAASETVGCQ